MDRSDVSYLHPDWTKDELSILIEEWRNLVVNYRLQNRARPEVPGGIDNLLAKQLSQRSNKSRSPCAIARQRCYLYDFVRFINRFDEMQQVSGGPLWFNMTKEEQDKVSMSARERKTSSILSQASFETLVKLKSVKKCTRFKRIRVSKTGVKNDIRRLEKCRSCWSAPEVNALVRSWSLVMKKSGTSVGVFVAQSSAESATLYTPWNHSTISAWRKMKRLASSYQFIRDFNTRHSPAMWFQLSDGAQNMWIDWDALPADFEDISQNIFEQIHGVDLTSSSETVKPGTEGGSIVKYSDKVSVFDNFPNPDEGMESAEEYRTTSNFCISKPKLRSESPHLPNYASSPITFQKGTKQTRDKHQECNSFYEHMEQLQKKQYKQAIQRLRTDIERDIRLSIDMTRAIFFERLGNPSQSGDATFVASLLDAQQRQLRQRFAQFQREHFYEIAANGYTFRCESVDERKDSEN